MVRAGVDAMMEMGVGLQCTAIMPVYFTSGGSIPNARSPRSSLSDQTRNMAIFAKK